MGTVLYNIRDTDSHNPIATTAVLHTNQTTTQITESFTHTHTHTHTYTLAQQTHLAGPAGYHHAALFYTKLLDVKGGEQHEVDDEEIESAETGTVLSAFKDTQGLAPRGATHSHPHPHHPTHTHTLTHTHPHTHTHTHTHTHKHTPRAPRS